MSTKKFVARHGLDANFNTISNVADPVNGSDVATKSVTDVIDTKAGLAFDTANTGVSIAQAAFDSSNNVAPQIQPSFDHANAAFAAANSEILLQSGINATQNTNIDNLNSWLSSNNTLQSGINATQNTYSTAAFTHANAAFSSSNTKFSSSGGTISGSVDVTGTLTVEGNLTVSGNVTTISANNVSIQDNMIYLNEGANVDNPDIGIAGAYNDGTYHHTGIFRDATDGYWKVFDNYQPEPDASVYINTSDASFRIANFQANTITGSLFSGSGASLTSLPAGQLSGTIPSGVLGNSTHYVGTTAIALNRASGSQTLTGVSIDGKSANSDLLNSISGTLDLNSQPIGQQGANGYGNDSTSNLPVSPGGAAQWWNTLNLGVTNRWTQLAFQAYGDGAGNAPQNDFWMRSKHDSTWSSWYRILTSKNYTSYALPISGGSLTGPLTITGNGSYIGNYGYSTLILQDTSGYPGINFRSGNSNWLFRMVAGGSELTWNYSSNASAQGTGTYAEHLKLNTDYLYHSSDMRSPQFYDSENTAYYIDPNATSNIYGLTVNQTITGSVSGNAGTVGSVAISNICSGNNGTATSDAVSDMNSTTAKSGFYLYNNPTNAPTATWQTWLNASGHYAGDRYGWQLSHGYWDNDLWVRGVNSNSWRLWRKILDSNNYTSYAMPAGASATNSVDVRAPIFYDSNNTGYYLNPDNTSNLYDVNMHYGHCGNFAGTAANGTATSQLQVQNAGGTGDNDVAAISFHCGGYYGAKLHLRSDSYFGVGGWSAAAWRWYVQLTSGDMTAAGNVTAYSDPRLKEDITPITSAVEKIKQLNGMKFKWIDSSVIGHPGEYDYGILSNEVQEIAPEIVVDSVFEAPEGDKYKTVAYDKLIPFLIEAIKEQQNQLDLQSNEINKLKELLKAE